MWFRTLSQPASKFPKKSIFHEPLFTNGDWRIFIDKSRKMLNDMLPRCTIQKEVSKMYPSQTIVRLNDPISGVVKFSLFSALLLTRYITIYSDTKRLYTQLPTHIQPSLAYVSMALSISQLKPPPLFFAVFDLQVSSPVSVPRILTTRPYIFQPLSSDFSLRNECRSPT